MLKRVGVAVYESLKKFVAGEELPASTTFDLESEGVGYATSGGFVDDIRPQLDDLKQKIIAGEITVATTP